jgi:hypothetical protein
VHFLSTHQIFARCGLLAAETAKVDTDHDTDCQHGRKKGVVVPGKRHRYWVRCSGHGCVFWRGLIHCGLEFWWFFIKLNTCTDPDETVKSLINDVTIAVHGVCFWVKQWGLLMLLIFAEIYRFFFILIGRYLFLPCVSSDLDTFLHTYLNY